MWWAWCSKAWLDAMQPERKLAVGKSLRAGGSEAGGGEGGGIRSGRPTAAAVMRVNRGTHQESSVKGFTSWSCISSAPSKAMALTIIMMPPQMASVGDDVMMPCGGAKGESACYARDYIV